MNLAILQARMSSTRLPNKVMKTVLDRPLLDFECERILRSKKIDKLIIATSTHKSDDPIAVYGKNSNLSVFRGSLENVLERYYQCAKEFKDIHHIENLNIIRLTGDCPLIDPNIIDAVIQLYETSSNDYVSNTLQPTYPDGMDVEIFSYEALTIAQKQATFPSDKEHVTLYIKNHQDFKKQNLFAPIDFSHLRLTVDEDNDFVLMKHLLENLYPLKKNFGYMDIIAYMTKNPELFYINAKISRDEGLYKSLRKDGRI